jgi:hypothetical protein
MSVKVIVNMKEEYMIDFMLRHTYNTFAGIAGAIIGVLAAGLGITTMLEGHGQAAFPPILIAILFLYVTPKNTINRAKQQVRKTEMFQKPLEYEFTEEGVTVRQDEVEVFSAWEEFTKATESKKSIVLYVSRIRAIIFPKECLGENYADVVKMIREHMKTAKVRVRG